MSGWNVVGDIAGSLIDAGRQNWAWNKQKDFTREQMAWQTQMSSTAYQRAAKDLEKAGLNRILAIGNPASTGSASGTSMPSTSSAVDARQKYYQNQLIKAQTRKANAEASKEEFTKEIYDRAKPYLDNFLDWVQGVIGQPGNQSPRADSPTGSSAKAQSGKTKVDKALDLLGNMDYHEAKELLRKYEKLRIDFYDKNGNKYR